MKQLIKQTNSYTIFSVGPEYLHAIAKFVIVANYSRHTKNTFPIDMKKEIDSIYREELEYMPSSQLFIAENRKGQMIGCIRVMKWDFTNELPAQKIFKINPLNQIANIRSATSIWHVGRFAVRACNEISSISLFKQLMLYAITPICQDEDSYMIAECDSKLLRIMGLLGIDTTSLGSGIHYLGSQTIPVYATKKNLSAFYNKYHLQYNTKEIKGTG